MQVQVQVHVLTVAVTVMIHARGEADVKSGRVGDEDADEAEEEGEKKEGRHYLVTT